MNANKSRFWIVLFSALLTARVLAAGGHIRQDMSPLLSPPSVRDEPDPNDSRSCYTLGRLDISFQTEKKGPPAVGLIVADPRGRRIGFDPIKNKGWQELPEADGFIDCDAPDGEGACRGRIQICGPLSGTYQFEVIAKQDAEYNLSVSGQSQEIRVEQGLRASQSQAELNDIAIRKGARDLLLLNYSRDLHFKIALQLPLTPQAGSQ